MSHPFLLGTMLSDVEFFLPLDWWNSTLEWLVEV